jgi:hypothetical protein
MGLVEACDAHQVGFNVESRFYLNPQEYVNIILSRRYAARLCGNRLGGPLQRQSNVPPLTRTAASLRSSNFCNLHQKKIDTARRFDLEQGRFRCPFAEQNKKDWDHPPSPTNARRIDSGYKTNALATL